MKEVQILKDMVNDTELKFTKEEFIYQIEYIGKIFDNKDKEIELKDKHIEELEYKIENTLFKANMYKSMIQGIFDKI